MDRDQLCLHIKTFNFIRLAMSGSKFVLEGNGGRKYDSELFSSQGTNELL
jgi:hypothetical protein